MSDTPTLKRGDMLLGKYMERSGWEHLFPWKTVYISTPSSVVLLSVVSVICINHGPENDPLSNVPPEGQQNLMLSKAYWIQLTSSHHVGIVSPHIITSTIHSERDHIHRTFTKYRWPFNNMSLNCTGLLICGTLSIQYSAFSSWWFS